MNLKHLQPFPSFIWLPLLPIFKFNFCCHLQQQSTLEGINEDRQQPFEMFLLGSNAHTEEHSLPDAEHNHLFGEQPK